MSQKAAGNLRLIAIVVLIGVFVFFVANPGTKQFSSTGYENAFENPQITFYGTSFNGHNYLTNNPTSLSFNPKMLSPTGGLEPLYLPTVDGEMTPVFIPAQSATYMNVLGVTLPSSWTQNLDMYYAPGWQNNPTAELQNPPQPVMTYNWNVSDSSGTPYMVQMQQWDQKFYCSFSTQWITNQDPALYLSWPLIGHTTNYYTNLWIWFKVATPVTWYIQGDGTAYQAIAQINMDDNAQMQARDNKGNNVQVDSAEVVNPESAASVVYLYYSPFGGSASTNPTPETYEGNLLNPAYFRNVTYFGIDLATFGNYADLTGALGQNTITRGDVATFDLDVTTFVFGQYTVLDIMNNPTQYGRTTPETTTTNFLSGIISWLTNPVNIGILTTIGLLVLVIIFAPWLLVVIIALVFGGKRR
jgi:hypothetical protein